MYRVRFSDTNTTLTEQQCYIRRMLQASSSYQCPKPAVAPPKAGPGSGRLTALKEAFKMQYQNQVSDGGNSSLEFAVFVR